MLNDTVSFLIVTLTPVTLGTLVGTYLLPDEWYKNLRKPSFTPPNAAFGIVWPVLYILIGLAAYFALVDEEWYYWIPYVLQLIFNLSFSPVNFGLRSILGGAIVTTLTLVLAIGTTIQYGIIAKYISVGLMIPYLGWLLFASVLAWTIVRMN